MVLRKRLSLRFIMIWMAGATQVAGSAATAMTANGLAVREEKADCEGAKNEGAAARPEHLADLKIQGLCPALEARLVLEITAAQKQCLVRASEK